MKKVKIKKYKLIKTYPTSPKLGSEVDVSADADPYKDFPDNWDGYCFMSVAGLNHKN